MRIKTTSDRTRFYDTVFVFILVILTKGASSHLYNLTTVFQVHSEDPSVDQRAD